MHMRNIQEPTANESNDVEVFENTILRYEGIISSVDTEDSYRIAIEGDEHELMCER